MWRGAHGRLAAIVVLAGGLSSCAPTPAPKSVAGVEDDNHTTTAGMHCGYYAPLSPETLAELVEKEVQRRCGASAVSGNRYGLIRVVMRRENHAEPVFVTEGGEDLSDDDRRCVAQAAQLAIPKDRRRFRDDSDYYFPPEFTLDLALGTPPPLLGM